MGTSVGEDIRDFVAWLNAGDVPAAAGAEELLARPAGERDAWLKAHPEAVTWHLATRLLDVARTELDRDPREAEAVTGLVIRNLDRFAVPAEHAPLAAQFRSMAWRERGNALRILGELPAARDAFEEALRAASDDPALRLDAAMARRGAAYVRHLMGVPGEPLRTIRADVPLFAAANDIAGVLRSRLYEAAIEYDLAHYDAAAQIFGEATRLAEQLGDEETLARLQNNLGHCARNLGRRDEAVRYLLQAIRLFHAHGMTAEPFRAEWGIELLRADEGAVTQAVAELRNMIATLIQNARPLEAALVALDVVELLVLSERYDHVKRVASDLVSVFQSSKMPREAMRAFTALRASAEAGTVTAKEVRAVALRLQDSAEQ